jgi:hypothetical protein
VSGGVGAVGDGDDAVREGAVGGSVEALGDASLVQESLDGHVVLVVDDEPAKLGNLCLDQVVSGVDAVGAESRRRDGLEGSESRVVAAKDERVDVRVGEVDVEVAGDVGRELGDAEGAVGSVVRGGVEGDRGVLQTLGVLVLQASDLSSEGVEVDNLVDGLVVHAKLAELGAAAVHDRLGGRVEEGRVASRAIADGREVLVDGLDDRAIGEDSREEFVHPETLVLGAGRVGQRVDSVLALRRSATDVSKVVAPTARWVPANLQLQQSLSDGQGRANLRESRAGEERSSDSGADHGVGRRLWDDDVVIGIWKVTAKTPPHPQWQSPYIRSFSSIAIPLATKMTELLVGPTSLALGPFNLRFTASSGSLAACFLSPSTCVSPLQRPGYACILKLLPTHQPTHPPMPPCNPKPTR